MFVLWANGMSNWNLGYSGHTADLVSFGGVVSPKSQGTGLPEVKGKEYADAAICIASHRRSTVQGKECSQDSCHATFSSTKPLLIRDTQYFGAKTHPSKSHSLKHFFVERRNRNLAKPTPLTQTSNHSLAYSATRTSLFPSSNAPATSAPPAPHLAPSSRPTIAAAWSSSNWPA